jgi:two-component system response regulator RegX3
MARVLVVEERTEARVAALVRTEGFDVVTAPGGAETSQWVKRHQPDVVIIEVERANRPALQLCGAVRAVTTAPIMVFSAHDDEREAVSSYNAGADVHVSEPVGAHEIVARVRAMLRWIVPSTDPAPGDTIVVGPVVLDRASRQLRVYGELIAVPRRELDIAELLMRKAGRVVTRDELVRELWGTARDTKSLDVQVGRLRTKLAAAEGRRRIVTVRGVGFRFVADDEPDPDSGDVELPHLDVVIDLPAAERAVTIELLDDDLLEDSASA